MALKFTVEMTEDEIRDLTIEEECMLEIRNNSYYPCRIRDDIEYRLKEIGFIDTIVIDGKRKGKFNHTIVIRDATPEEIVAWHVLEIAKICNCDDDDTELFCNNKCPLNILRTGEKDRCMIDLRSQNARKVLDGKKIIVTEINDDESDRVN